MKALKRIILIGSILAVPTLSFAQQTNTPMNDATKDSSSAASMHDAQSNQPGSLYQQPSRKPSASADSSGYGGPLGGSSQWSAARPVGKHSPVFDH